MTSFGNTGGGPVEKIRIEADGSQAKREAKSVEDRLGQMFDKSALKAAAFNQALALGSRALSGMVDWLKQGVQSALEYERTTRQLNVVVRNLGDTSGYWVSKLQEQSGSLERLTGISDEVIRRYQVMALNMGTSTDRVDDLIRASISLGNAMDIDVRTAMVQIVKTQTGLVEETLKSTRAVEGLTKEQLQAGQAIDVINEKFGEQLSIMTQGGAGATVGLATAWANLGEEIGKFGTEASTGVALIEKLADAIQQMADGLTNIRNLDPEALLKGYLGTLTAPFAGIPGALGLGAYAAGSGGPTGPLPLEPLVSPAAVGGAGTMRAAGRGRGRGGRGGGGGISALDFGAGQEEWQDFVIAPNGQIYSQANWDAMQELSAQVEEGLRERAQSNLDYHVELSNRMIAEEERVAEARKKLSESSWGASAKAAVTATQQALGAIQAFAQGGLVGMLQYAASVAASYGMQSIASGTAHEALAASLAFIPGMQAAAAGLAASAANEIAVGTALAVGGNIAGAAIGLGRQAASGGFSGFNVLTGPGGGGGSGGGGETTPSTFAGGFTGGFGVTSQSEDGDKSITIVIQGDVLDGAETGRKVFNAIAEAKRQGLI